jgi:O-antigen ligase
MLMDAVVASIYLAVCLIMLLENMWPLGVAAKSACAVILLVGAVLTGSRGFLVMLMVYFAVRAKKVLSSWKRVALALGSVLVVVVACLLAWGDELSTIVDNFQTLVNYQEDPSSMSRKDKFESSMAMFVENPVFGIGSNNFQSETNSEVVVDETLTTNPHNVYAQVLAENGLLGGLFVAWMAVQLWVHRRKVDPALRVAMMALCIGIGYIGVLNSLPLVVMFVGFLCCFRNAICSESRLQS